MNSRLRYTCLFNISTWMLTRYLKRNLSRISPLSTDGGPILPFFSKHQKPGVYTSPASFSHFTISEGGNPVSTSFEIHPESNHLSDLIHCYNLVLKRPSFFLLQLTPYNFSYFHSFPCYRIFLRSNVHKLLLPNSISVLIVSGFTQSITVHVKS